MGDAEALIQKIAQIADAVAFSSGTASIEYAGAIVSHLAAHPEDVETFMRDGNEMMLDGRMTLTSGYLSYQCSDGRIRSSREIRNLAAVTGKPLST